MGVSINISDKDIKKMKVKKADGKTNSKPSKKKSILFYILFSFLVLTLGAGLYFVYKGYKIGKDLGFNFKPGQLVESKEEPELKKDPSGNFTNVLLVGIDTRENSGLLNTDVIMVASYNHTTDETILISIPRDFHAQVQPDVYWFNKINSAYHLAEGKQEGTGLPTLQNIVEEIVGLEIQYYAMIDFKGFVELIDAVGGVYVNVENSFTDYMYPAETGHQTVSFEAGPQLMDGETALKYSRSRHSLQNGEGSDYARARRQQRVIAAFKDAVMSSDTLLNPSKVMALLTSVQDNIKISEFNLNDIQAGVSMLKDASDIITYSFVLDPNSGNRELIKITDTIGYGIGPVLGLGNYEDINEYVDLVQKYPSLYSESPSIYFYNTSLGYQETYDKTTYLRDKFKYLNIRFMGNRYEETEDIMIFSNKENEFNQSVKILADYLDITTRTKPEELTTRFNGEDISILCGETVVEEEESENSSE